jgi:molybdopterin-guanine dinucleotide biosynthesis protein A
MGRPKATLPFGPELMLPRVLRLVGEVVGPRVVVAAPGQELPPLESDILVVRDEREGRGPLEGLAAGLAALPQQVASAYVTSCDVPLLVPAFIRRMIELSAGYDIAVPYCQGYHHPLAAVYRTTVLPLVRRLLAEDRLRPVFLFDLARTRLVGRGALADVDADLHSLRNLNHPQDYLAALALAGYKPPAGALWEEDPAAGQAPRQK